MTELYARPDHEVIEDLLPGISDRRLDDATALARIAETPGMVPVGIDPRGEGRIMWADLGDHPFREWQFLFTVKKLADEGTIGPSFTSSLDVLRNEAFSDRGLDPTGFIFHVSRCGSTLVAKALAQAETTVVINQGGPLQHGLWAVLTSNWSRPLDTSEENLTLFRQLVRAMTRPRRSGQKEAFVKFISWNTLYMDFVAKAFPEARNLFLYRNASEVIASVQKNTTAALEAMGSPKGAFISGDPEERDPTAFLARCYANYFEMAADSGNPNRILVNYTSVNAANGLKIMAEGLGFTPDATDEERVLEQFSLYSKDDTAQTVFTSDREEKRKAVPEAQRDLIDRFCMAGLNRLDGHDRNLFKTDKVG